MEIKPMWTSRAKIKSIDVEEYIDLENSLLMEIQTEIL